MRSTSSTRSRSTEGAASAQRRRLLAALVGLPLAACGKKAPRYEPIPAGSTVLALGDSLTFGSGAPAEAAYPARLGALTGWNVVNAGVAGDTSVQARARLAPLLAAHQPKLVLLSIGGNDLLRQVPEATTRAHIAAMLVEIRAAGTQAVLIAAPKPAVMAALLRSLDDHPLYEALAAEHGVPLFAGGWSKVLSDPRLKADQIHANAAGYERFARELHGFLRDAGLAPAQ